MGSPEETSAETEKRTSEDIKASHAEVNREEKRQSVDTVSKSSESESKLDTEDIDEGSTEEGEDGKGRVESDVLFTESAY